MVVAVFLGGFWGHELLVEEPLDGSSAGPSLAKGLPGRDQVGVLVDLVLESPERAPKYESERTVYLPDEVVTMLSEHVRVHTPDGGPSRWLSDECGQPWHDNPVDYRWRSTRIDAGVTYKLHELRHYFASGLIAAGCDVVTVQRAMGHASATTTLNTYAHLWPTGEDKTRAATAGMAAEVLATHLPRMEGEQASDLRK